MCCGGSCHPPCKFKFFEKDFISPHFGAVLNMHISEKNKTKKKLSQSVLWPKFQAFLVARTIDVGRFEVWQESTTQQTQTSWRTWLDNDPWAEFWAELIKSRQLLTRLATIVAELLFFLDIDFQEIVAWFGPCRAIPQVILPPSFLFIWLYSGSLCALTCLIQLA